MTNKFIFPPQDGRACGYLRRSQQEAEYEQYGQFAILERHNRVIEGMARDYGHVLQKIYREVVSGETIEARSEFKQLLGEIARGEWDIVYVVEASRLGRGSGSDQDKIINAFRHPGTWLITEGKIYNPKSKADMRMLRKELQKAYDERDSSVDRLYNGRKRAASEGCYMPSRAPYGWEIDWIERNRTLKPHPVNYDRMMSIYDMLDEGKSLNKIANEFEDLDYPTSHGAKHWCCSAIKQIAQNPVNIGKITWEATNTEEITDPNTLDSMKVRVFHDEPRIVVDGYHKKHCTLDEAKFYRVQRKIEARSPYSTVHGKPLQNPLAGILRCKKCGGVLKWSLCKKLDPPKAIYAHNEQKKKHEGCNCKSVHVSVLMDALIEALESLAHDRKLELTDEGRVAARERHLKAIETCKSDIQDAHEEKRRVMLGYRKGVYTDEEFVEEKRLADERIETLEAHLTQLVETVPDEEAVEREIVTIGKCLEILRMDATPQETNDALKQFIRAIYYENFAPPRKLWHDIRLEIEWV